MSSLSRPLIISVNKINLEQIVKMIHKYMAANPFGHYHFEMGRQLALKFGYPSVDPDQLPAEAIDSSAGISYHFGLADAEKRNKIQDLGSGSGMDLFIVSPKANPHGSVIGVDMTDEPLLQSQELAEKV